MITHDQVMSEVRFLEWQIAAWNAIQETNEYASIQINYLKKRVETLKKWDSEKWQI